MKKKVISVVSALSLSASMTPLVNAASSSYHTTRYNGSQQYYVDDYGNKVYDNYIIDANGNRVYNGYYFDGRDNAIIDYSYENNGYSYSDYRNYLDSHLTIDISDDATLQRYLVEHRKTCNDYECKMGYDKYINYGNIQNNYQGQYYGQPIPPQNNQGIYVDPNFNPNYNPNLNPNFNPNYNPNMGQNNTIAPNYNNTYYYENDGVSNTALGFYTMVKTQNGITKYAYSREKDLTKYGIYGWQVNSVYNENDYDLNSVFHEEIFTFGNDFRYNSYVVNQINTNSNLYIWTYIDNYGTTKYCVSPTKFPGSLANLYTYGTTFAYNSDFNINDMGPLKTINAAIAELRNSQSYQYYPNYVYSR